MKVTRIFVYYTIAFLQGLTIVVIPAASTIFKAAEENAISDAEYGLLTLPMIVIGYPEHHFTQANFNFTRLPQTLLLFYSG